MPNIALIVAMRTELPYGFKDAGGIYQIGNNVIRVAVSGIGPNRARRTAQRMCAGLPGYHPDLLINAGFCGAVIDELQVGHLIIANRLAYRDREIQLNNSPTEKIVALFAGFKYRVGKLQTFSWPVLSRAGVVGDTLAVDMEAFAIARTAAMYQVPSLVIKAVSDIVPQHAGLFSLLTLVRNLKINSKTARDQLSMIVNKIFENQYLFDESEAIRPETAKTRG